MLAEGRNRAGEVLAALREQILGGQYPPGSSLPTATQLRAEFGTSPSVIVSALRELQREGLVTVRVGRGGGTRVTERHLTAWNRDDPGEAEDRAVEPADAALARTLEIEEGTPVERRWRLHRVAGEAVWLSTLWTLPDAPPPDTVTEEVQARPCTGAERRLLQMGAEVPVLRVIGLGTAEGRVVLLREDLLRSDRISVPLRR